MSGGYGEDLAAIHDAGFTGLAEAAARMVQERHPPPAHVADLGCGSGIMLDRLAEAGYAVWGCDVSAAMARLARARVPAATVLHADAATGPVPATDVVTAVGEVLNHACASHGSEAIARRFHDVRAALAPGGLFLFDIATTGRPDERTRAWREGQGWRLAAGTEQKGGWLTRTIDTWRAGGGRERRGQEVHRLRLLHPDWVQDRLQDAGFAARRLGGYDDFGFQPGWDGFFARA